MTTSVMVLDSIELQTRLVFSQQYSTSANHLDIPRNILQTFRVLYV